MEELEAILINPLKVRRSNESIIFLDYIGWNFDGKAVFDFLFNFVIVILVTEIISGFNFVLTIINIC